MQQKWYSTDSIWSNISSVNHFFFLGKWWIYIVGNSHQLKSAKGWNFWKAARCHHKTQTSERNDVEEEEEQKSIIYQVLLCMPVCGVWRNAS